MAPKITIHQDRSFSTIPKIGIIFPDGHEDRMILKRHFVTDDDIRLNKMNCNFLGRLEKDKNACLAVTGCPGQPMEFTIHSSHNIDTNKYVLHPSGVVEMVPASSTEDYANHLDNKYDMDLERASTCCTRDDTSCCKPLPESNQLNLKVNIP